MRHFLRKLWHVMPVSFRETALSWGCSLLLGSPQPAPQPSEAPTFVFGFFSQASGLGESARLWYSANRAGGSKVVPVDITRCFADSDIRFADPACLSVDDVKHHQGPGRLVLHINPPRFLLLLALLGRSFLQGKTVVAYWAWELEDLPGSWIDALRYCHEMEVPSAFVAHAIRRYAAIPVRVVPPPVPAALPRARTFAEDGITRVLFMFDMGSLASRKNPQAAIDAFRLAFADRQDVRLTLKVTKPVEDRLAWDRLRLYVKSLSNVSILSDTLTHIEMARLYDTHDIYLSLHRAEGYGLTIREAMQHGMHVVATGWSGNMDFMHGNNVWPVQYELVPVHADGDFRGMAACRWAEPSIEDAARILKEIDSAERSRARH